MEARERRGASPSTGTVVPWRCFRFTALWRGLPARRAAKQAVPGEGGGGAAWRRAARDAPSAQHGNEYLLSRGRSAGDRTKCVKSGFSQAQVLPVLAEFEAEFEHDLTPRLLVETMLPVFQMDTITGNDFPILQNQLRAVAADERLLHGMALKAAGLSG